MNNYANSLKAIGKFEQSKNLYEKILDKDVSNFFFTDLTLDIVKYKYKLDYF